MSGKTVKLTKRVILKERNRFIGDTMRFLKGMPFKKRVKFAFIILKGSTKKEIEEQIRKGGK